jgi:hypothetical protein
MKKLLQIASLLIATSGIAQVSMQIKNTGNNQTVASNATVYSSTSVGNTTSDVFDIKNTSASTQTYVLYRYDILLHASATANFCFAGSCFPPPTVISGNLVLNAGQSASQSTVANTMLTADLNEDGSTVGLSRVKYTFKNINTPADTIQFMVSYNDVAAGLKESVKSLVQLDVFPNPATDHVNVCVALKGNATGGEITILNALGQVMITKPVAFVDGKNNVSLNTNELPKGIYFVRIKNFETITIKRIIIN